MNCPYSLMGEVEISFDTSFSSQDNMRQEKEDDGFSIEAMDDPPKEYQTRST